MVNSGLTLLINNQQFYTYQPMMTADGSEFVLLNRPNSGLPGLQILRRIRVMEKEGALRFLEVLTNSNANAISAVGIALWCRLCSVRCGYSASSLRVSSGGPAKGTMTARRFGLASSWARLGRPAMRTWYSAGSGSVSPVVITTGCSSRDCRSASVSADQPVGK